MTRYFFPVPNGPIYGAALRVTNTDSGAVTGLYADAGVFLTYDDGSEIPLATIGQQGITTFPANSVVWIHQMLPTPIQAGRQCRIAVDSTSLPSTCRLKVNLAIGAAKVEVANVQS